VPICDGCGAQVDAGHIRQRIERLELATRFRPVHINVLLLDSAPPAFPGDLLYDPAPANARTAGGSSHVVDLLALAGISVTPEVPLESGLAEFQRRGFFLTFAVECPIDNPGDLPEAIRQLAPTVVRRVRASYKPKYVALLSDPTRELIAPLQAAGWSDRLILENGGPFREPSAALARVLATISAAGTA
jgi:hypothetical protein